MFIQGLCKNCPLATNHTPKGCYLVLRQKKLDSKYGGKMPEGQQWCSRHKYGWHFQSDCNAAKRSKRRYEELTKKVEAKLAELEQKKAKLQDFRAPASEEGDAGKWETKPKIEALALSISKLSDQEKNKLSNLLL